jgi:hypothetical protein
MMDHISRAKATLYRNVEIIPAKMAAVNKEQQKQVPRSAILFTL